MKGAVLVAALLWAVACGNPPNPIANLPHGYVVLGSASHELAHGSYCWRSGSAGMCADMLSPESVLKDRHLAPFRVAAGQSARLRFSEAPSTVQLNERLTPLPPYSEIDLRAWAPALGVHTYVVSARWPSGDVEYVFQLDVHA